MVILGLLLLGLAVAAVIVLIGANTGEVDVSALGGTWTVPIYWLVVTGIALTAAAMLGVVFIVLGGARARRQRTRRRELERENRRLASQAGEPSLTEGGGAKRPVDGDTRHIQPVSAPAAAPPAAPPGSPRAAEAFPPAPGYPPPPAPPAPDAPRAT